MEERGGRPSDFPMQSARANRDSGGRRETAGEGKRVQDLRTRNYFTHQVQVNQDKSWIVDSAQPGIGEIQGVAWRVIHHGN